MALLTLTIIAVAVSALYWYFTRTFNYWKDRNVPGPKPVPFFGNLLKSALRYQQLGIPLKEAYDSFPDEKVVGVFRMTTPCLVIRDLDVVKHVFIKDFDNFVDRGVEFSKEGLGQNLFHSDGETWRALRSRFSPIFTNQKLKNMMYLLDDRANKFVDYVTDQITTKSPELDVHDLVQKYTLAAITACAFGLDNDPFREDLVILKKISSAALTPSFAIELDMMYPGILKKFNSTLFPEYLIKFFRELVDNVITHRNGMPSNRRDFMDLILEMRNKKEIQTVRKFGDEETKTIEITNSVIEAQAFVFYLAGYETSASTISFMLYHIALDPVIQERLRNEIDEYLQRHNDRIEVDTLNELTYFDQVFNETLRMYPIVETLQRRAENDYVCPGTNVKVAKEQMVLVSVLGIHRDPKYYPDPDTFNPDNFAPEKVAGRHSCAHLPFGIGPRHCIGMRFAQVQSRVGLVRLLSKFRMEPSKNTIRSFSFDPKRVVLSPSTPLYINFCPREDL